jgi:capsid protein
MQIIDGGHIKNPIYSSQFFTQATKRGNKIIEGIEFNKRGERIAFYVMQEDFTSQRILAKHQKTGRKQAWLFLGLKYKLDSKRGLSLLAVLLETAAKIDRYKDATITAAEDLANVPFTFEHESYSDGEDPNDALIAQSSGTERVQQMQDSYADCEALAPKVALSTKRRVYNLPVGASLKKTQQGTDINFEKFFGVNSGVLYTTFGMPPEIATDKFGGSYSASRAALMAWQYKMMVDRMILLNRQFYSPFYNFWLDFQIITGKIEVDGYFEALISGDFMKLAAFRKARFTGKTVDHIDPLKEAKALRTLLGDKYANVPLKTVEQAMEFINSGEFNTNIEKSKNEQEIIDNAGFGIEPEPTKSE